MTTLERSASGTEHPLDAPLLTFDILAVLTQLNQEETWQRGNRDVCSSGAAHALAGNCSWIGG